MCAQPDMNVTLDTLHLVFSAFGLVQKIATFEKGQGFQALVQYADAETAEQVRNWLAVGIQGGKLVSRNLLRSQRPPSVPVENDDYLFLLSKTSSFAQ